MTLLMPLTAEHVTASQGGLFHAADLFAVLRASRNGRRTVDTVCGRRRAMLAAADGMVLGFDPIAGEESLVPARQVLPWRPPIRKAREAGYEVCAECLKSTGARTPHPLWRSIEQAAVRAPAVAS